MSNYAPLKRGLLYLVIAPSPQRKFVASYPPPPKKMACPSIVPPPKKKKKWCLAPPLLSDIVPMAIFTRYFVNDVGLPFGWWSMLR